MHAFLFIEPVTEKLQRHPQTTGNAEQLAMRGRDRERCAIPALLR